MRSKVSPERREQIVEMSKEGKSNKEIGLFLMERYQEHVPYSTLYALIKGRKKGKKRHSADKQDVAPKENIAQIITEIKSLIDELHCLYSDSLKAIRGSLVEACGKIREIREREQEK